MAGFYTELGTGTKPRKVAGGFNTGPTGIPAAPGEWGSDLNLGQPDPMYFQRRQEAAMPPPPVPSQPEIRTTPVASRMPASVAALDASRQTTGYQRGNGASDTAVSSNAYDVQQQTQLEHDLRMKEQKARTDSVSALMGQFAGGSNSPRVTRTPENQAAEQASRDAAFARAKEKAGQTARASMQTLQGVLDERGLMGSSIEGAETGNIIGGAAGDIGEFLRDQAITESNRAADISDMDFSAQVAQRGQEMSRKQAMMSLLGSMLY